MKDWHKVYDIRESPFTNTVRFFNPHDHTKGDTYYNEQISFTNLAMHDSFTDLMDTMNHEAKHASLKREELTDDMEHECLKLMNQVECGMITL